MRCHWDGHGLCTPQTCCKPGHTGGQMDIPVSPLKLGAMEPEWIRLTEPLLAPLQPGWLEEARGEAGGAVGICWELRVCCVVFQGGLKLANQHC